MLAFVCRPGHGSEPGVGWEFLRAAARDHDVTLLTHPVGVDQIRDALTAEGLSHVTVVPLSGLPQLGRFEWHMGIGHLGYLVWQYRAWATARRLADRLDVVHHVTFGNDWFPSAGHFLDGLPVVWGPVGGTSRVPWRLARFFSIRGLVGELLRESATKVSRRLVAIRVRRSGCFVVTVNSDSAATFERLGAPVVVEPHVAIPPLQDHSTIAPAASPADGRRRAVFAGRLISWKGPHLAVAALAAAGQEWTLDIYGEGPEAGRIRRRAERMGVATRVRMLGQQPRDRVLSALATADVLLFPSMHDPSPFIVGEAVSLGCPVVCLDVGGPPLLIAGTTGEAVPADGHAAERMADAMNRVRRHSPSDRWSGDRLPKLVTEWYEAAVANAARRNATT